MTMTSFESTIRKRLRNQTAKAVIVFLIVILTYVLKVYLHGGIEFVSRVDRLILMGLFVGGEISSIRAILKYRMALKTPEALEKLHIAEADERNKIIILKTCQSTIKLAITLLSFAGIVSSFFSVAVMLTICVILIAFLTLYAVLALYYSRKY